MKTRSKLSATAIILLLALGGLLAIESFQNLISGANVGALNFTISEVHTLVTLISPDDGAGIPGGNITFNYNVTGIVTLTNCSLMLDGAFISTAASPARNITLNFTRRMVGGDYAWWITCVNTLNVRFNSSIRGFTITEAAAPAVLRTGNQPANPVTEIINTIIVGEIKANELKTIQIGDEKSSVESLAVRLLRFVSDVKITVGTLFDLPAGIESPPQGNVYKYININAPKLENESIISLAEINFKVTKAWLDANEADKNSVSLARYKSATGWQRLRTQMTSEDSEFVHYVTQTPGFSTFAIVAETFGAVVPAAVVEIPAEEEKHAGMPRTPTLRFFVPTLAGFSEKTAAIVTIMLITIITIAGIAFVAKSFEEEGVQYLSSHISTAFERGYKSNYIKTALIRYGWHPHLVRKAILHSRLKRIFHRTKNR